MDYIDFDKLEKYKIEEHDGGLSYSKSLLVANSDSKNTLKIKDCFDDLYLNFKFDIEAGDTISISPFARASNNRKIYGFFIENLNNGDDSEIGIPISEKDYPIADFNMLQYAAKYIAATLKNSGLKDVKVLVTLIMNKFECQRYIYACDMLEDELLATEYIFKDISNLEKKELREADALICFRPEDLSVIITNLDKVKNIIQKGEITFGRYEVKGFVYLKENLEFNTNECGFYTNSRYSSVCKENGLYLCVDAPFVKREFDYDRPLIDEVIELCNELNIEATVSFGYINKKVDADFIKEDELKVVSEEILTNYEKYKANYELNSNKYLTDIFLEKNIENLIFSDVLVVFSPRGMTNLYEKIDELNVLLKNTKFFIKGFVYVKTEIETTSDCGIDFDEYLGIHRYTIQPNTLYFSIGHKDNYMSSYDIIYKIQELIGDNCTFSVVANVWGEEIENSDFISYITEKNEIEQIIKDLNNKECANKFLGNYMNAWHIDEAYYLDDEHIYTSKQLNDKVILLANFEEILDRPTTVYYTILDINKISLDDYAKALKLVNKYINIDLDERIESGYGYNKEFSFGIDTYNNPILVRKVMSIYMYIIMDECLVEELIYELNLNKEELFKLIDLDNIKSNKLDLSYKSNLCLYDKMTLELIRSVEQLDV